MVYSNVEDAGENSKEVSSVMKGKNVEVALTGRAIAHIFQGPKESTDVLFLNKKKSD